VGALDHRTLGEEQRMKSTKTGAGGPIAVERVQTGVRLEKRLLKVLKGLAEYHDMTVGDLLEGIILHAFEGRSALARDSIQKVRDLKRIYGMDYGAEASHRLIERTAVEP
jgi:predicted DNA-binding ribbon-helix-helix protein